MATNLRQMIAPTESGLLDPTNRRLLAALQQDARMSLAELGRQVGLSSPAVAERIKRLEAAGVIRGYHADIDPRPLGYTLGITLRIRPAPRQLATVAKLAQDTPEVIECQRITGDDCYLMTAYVRDVGHMETIIDSFAAYGQTTTSVMQSSPVPRRGVTTDA
jgi:Lrp/AsnC family leucine-responsive transcriptional regulator